MGTEVIAGLIGAVATGVVMILKQVFTKNENKELAYKHEERLIELIGEQNSSYQLLNSSIIELSSELKEIRKDLSNLKNELD
jgi:uncharacterized protein YlxW (UPF0749 family)